jgi:hypothetical protein
MSNSILNLSSCTGLFFYDLRYSKALSVKELNVLTLIA